MSPYEKCRMTPRICIPKGWGTRNEAVTRGVNTDGYAVDPFAKIGEVFVYHKYSPKFYSGTNPTFDVGTVKLLYIAKGKKLSNHFHLEKSEIFFMVKGKLNLALTSDGFRQNVLFVEGRCLLISPGMVHQMEGVEDENILLEVSTFDKSEDSYRIEKGD